MYGESLNKDMIKCHRCGSLKNKGYYFDIINNKNCIKNNYCEKCFSIGFENSFIELRKEFPLKILLNNPALVEAKMQITAINKYKNYGN